MALNRARQIETWCAAIPHKIRHTVYTILNCHMTNTPNPNWGHITERVNVFSEKIEYCFGLPFGIDQ